MFKKMTLGQKLVLLFLLVGMLSMGINTAIAYVYTSKSLTEEVERTLDLYVTATEGAFGDNIAKYTDHARLVAQLESLKKGLTTYYDAQTEGERDFIREENLNPLLQKLKQEYHLMITDNKGRVICTTNNKLLSVDLKNHDYIQQALAGKHTNSTIEYLSEINENVMIVVSPVFSEEISTEVLGTVGLILEANQIGEIVLDGIDIVGKTADAYFIDQNQYLLTEPRFNKNYEILKTKINTKGAELLTPAIRNHDTDYLEFMLLDDYQGNKCLTCLNVFNLGEHPMGFIMEIDYDEAYASVKKMQFYMLIVIGGIMVLIVIISNAFSRTVSLPIFESTQMVKQASGEIATGNQDLSQRTQEQAATLEEITSTLEEVNSSIQQVAASSNQADQIVKTTMEVVREGESSIQETMGAMEQIAASSQQIAEIIKLVDDIAFQTNLLALNAAVEAARAGEQGRGFAVVAAEVRNLAGRAAESAKEIEDLINESVDRSVKGHDMVKKSAGILDKIVDNTKRTSDVVVEVAAAMREQASASQQIQASAEQLNQVTQQNAAMVEEITSTSQNLSAEAEKVQNMIGHVKSKKRGKHWNRETKDYRAAKDEKKTTQVKSEFANTVHRDFKQDSLDKF